MKESRISSPDPDPIGPPPGGDAAVSAAQPAAAVENAPVSPAAAFLGYEPVPFTPPPSPPAPPVKRRTWGFWLAIILLALAAIGTGVYLTLTLLELERANTRIEKQDDEIDEQRELIEKKETFSAAMGELLDTAARFEGVLISTVVPADEFELVAVRAWAHRWDAAALDKDIAAAQDGTAELETILAAATLEATTNTTGSSYESVIDQLGAGFVASVVEDADTFCERDVIACVSSDDPLLVHFDIGDSALPYMTDVLRTGVAYHEFAHVLQFVYPEITETALVSFGGDVETMADCYALTYLDGWKLDHQIFVNRYEYWEVSIGYGLTCDEPQRQVIRDWFGQMGYRSQPVSQDR